MLAKVQEGGELNYKPFQNFKKERMSIFIKLWS